MGEDRRRMDEVLAQEALRAVAVGEDRIHQPGALGDSPG